MIDPGERDLRLLGAEGRHREQLHSEEQGKPWKREKQRRLPGTIFRVVGTGSTPIPPLAFSCLSSHSLNLSALCVPCRDLTYISLALGQRKQKNVIHWKERDADPGSGALLVPGSGFRDRRKSKQYLGSKMNIKDFIFENLVSVFGLKLLKLFDADPGSCQPWIRDPEWKKSDPGSWINILDPQHCEIPHSK